jgi:hypothetical protein
MNKMKLIAMRSQQEWDPTVDSAPPAQTRKEFLELEGDMSGEGTCNVN